MCVLVLVMLMLTLILIHLDLVIHTQKLFIYRPITIGERTAVYGGALEFFYSLHSIPCVGFAAYCNVSQENQMRRR